MLQTHGWGGTGQQDPGGFVGELLDAGYIVLTWDQRGFGCSGGEVTIDQPAKEGKDVSALIDWAVANAPVADDGGDPIVGMTGGSYAGGIQTAAASVDPRLDALAPEISWSDLRYTLYSGEVAQPGVGDACSTAPVPRRPGCSACRPTARRSRRPAGSTAASPPRSRRAPPPASRARTPSTSSPRAA